MADPVVLYQTDDKVGIITLNRPDKLNAISHDLQHALTETFARADADPATTVVRRGTKWLNRSRTASRNVCLGSDRRSFPTRGIRASCRSGEEKACARNSSPVAFASCG